jgi:hypothetical protein
MLSAIATYNTTGGIKMSTIQSATDSTSTASIGSSEDMSDGPDSQVDNGATTAGDKDLAGASSSYGDTESPNVETSSLQSTSSTSSNYEVGGNSEVTESSSSSSTSEEVSNSEVSRGSSSSITDAQSNTSAEE